MNHEQFMKFYVSLAKRNIEENSSYLSENNECKVLLEELIGLSTDWSSISQSVADNAKDLGFLESSAMVDYVEMMLFTFHQWIPMTLLLGSIEGCFYILRVLLEGLELALGLDVLEEYKSKLQWKDAEKNQGRRVIREVLSDLKCTNPVLHDALSKFYSLLSEYWVHSAGFFKRKSAGEIPAFALYPALLSERRDDIQNLTYNIKRFRKLLKEIVDEWMRRICPG
jgi:hypothetical protein